TSDVMAVLWRRFCLQAVLSAVTVHFGEPVGAVRTEAASRALMIAMISESVAVARARGVVLETGVEAMILQWLDRMPEGAGPAVDQTPGVDFPDLLIRYGEESGLEMPVVRGLATRSRDGARRGVA
ncbi:MAG: ketopantoate reductase C-terminal domain-containing protein, partial [Zavarzinia sp.]|nr:ketopantoate reductase C-terminal domain-containing protein [Zavarzinia sp.]